MRLFPRTARHRLTAATAACTLAIGALAVPLANAEPKDLKHKQQQAQQQVKSAEQDLDESSARLRRAQGALDRAIHELSTARGELRAASARLQAAEIRDREMQARLETAEQRLVDAQTDLADGQAALDDQRLKLTDTVTDIYEQGDPQLLAFATLLESRSTADLTRQSALNDVIVGREARAYDDLHAAEVLLQVRENQVQAARDDVEVQRQAAAEHLVTMETLHQEARAARDKVMTLVETRRDARAGAIRARQQDRKELQEAKRRENHVRQLILAAARRAKGGYTGPTNGLMIRPVPGVVTSPFGYRIHPIYGYWGLHDGTDFGVSCGEGMRAVASGTVIAKYFSSVYGNRLYLSLGQINGKNVTAVYNHATGYRVGVGDRVSQGEIVGYVGSTGWSTGCHLHFSILVNGTAVDPMNWLP
ncbi:MULTISPECIES: M23 family metallopeptidase [unclassified Nocardioides]|uniref:peptidoglycan DD-metalloendopeptidase family protein n=1 Tax=unclassified Nocardioides TaxID=2615069 RepID=UPI000056FC1C|nr:MULTISPECIES: M23 family metallopeptidase [unclassified Nocardioides]ABL80784.1 peptidase M23B [Nocardioides sp. JS614]